MSDKVQYAHSKVQPEDFTSGWAVAIVLTGLGVSLPMLYLGSEMAQSMGFTNALWAITIATVILTILCLLTTLIGNRSRLSTYMILRFPFGKQGAKFMNILMGISLLGWFSVALEILSAAISDTAKLLLDIDIPLWSIIVLGSILITLTTIYGIRTLEKLANIAVPILSIFLLYVVYIAVSGDIINPDIQPSAAPQMSLFEGMSALVGSSILVPVLMADFSRYIYNDKESLLSVLGIAIGSPLVWIIAAFLTLKTGEVDIILIMQQFHLVLPAFILIFVSTWMTNATNLYSVALTFSTVIEQWSYTKWTIITSIMGTLMALFGFSDYFIEFLNILAIFSPGIAAIYVLDFFWLRQQNYDLNEIVNWGLPAILAWAVSAIIAYCTYATYFILSGAYFIDSFIIAGILYVVLNYSKVNRPISNK